MVNEDYIKGLQKAIQLIEEEQEYAKQVDPIMCLGMEQVKNIIFKEIHNIKK